MKRFFALLTALSIALSACAILPVAKPIPPTSTPIPPTMTPLPPTPTPLPRLQDRFDRLQLILDKLIVQGNEVAVRTSEANITFTADGKINGKGGCNNFFGSYESPSSGQLKIGALGSTKMYCQETMTVETALFQVLQKVTRYRIDNIRLILESEDGQYLARFYVPVR